MMSEEAPEVNFEIENETNDTWYEKYHRKKETPDFLKWFIPFYGNSTDYEPYSDEQCEYWVRRGFALMGFLAAKSINHD
jgi:hypothetical protein